jgi:hypothetical protein
MYMYIYMYYTIIKIHNYAIIIYYT